MNVYWPIALVVASNIVYHICAKSLPAKVDPFASLVITYLVGAIVSLVCFFIFNPGENIARSYSNVNWTSFVLGLVIVGLEVGSIYAYKVGWNVNNAFLIESGLVSVCLLFVGYFIYREGITWTKVVGIVLCMAGLFFIRK